MNISENLLRGSTATDQDSRLSWTDRETTRDSVIQFEVPDSDDNDSEVCYNFISNFVALF